jgi:uroporphyrin-3 C-methyltransferase
MSNEMPELKTTTAATQKKNYSIPWRNIGITTTAFSIVVLLVVGSLAYSRLIAIDMGMAAQLENLQNQMLASHSNVEKTAQQFDDTLKTHQQTIDELYRAARGNREDWTATEAYFLVRLASANLQFTRNTGLAITLLKNADQELHTLNDPRLQLVRKALAIDITTLQALPQVDTKVIYLRLTLLNNQMDKLSLQHQSSVGAMQPAAEIDQTQSWWRRGLQTVWQALQKIVVVRHDQASESAMITPAQQALVYQNLHALIMQSLWALLHNEPEIYQASLQQAADAIKKYCTPDAAETTKALNNIAELQQIDIKPAMAQLDHSLQAFVDYFNNKQS